MPFQIVFNVQKFFIRFILSHMAVVNLGQWLSTVVQEVMTTSEEDFEQVSTSAPVMADQDSSYLTYQLFNASLGAQHLGVHHQNRTIALDRKFMLLTF